MSDTPKMEVVHSVSAFSCTVIVVKQEYPDSDWYHVRHGRIGQEGPGCPVDASGTRFLEVAKETAMDFAKQSLVRDRDAGLTGPKRRRAEKEAS